MWKVVLVMKNFYKGTFQKYSNKKLVHFKFKSGSMYHKTYYGRNLRISVIS